MLEKEKEGREKGKEKVREKERESEKERREREKDKNIRNVIVSKGQVVRIEMTLQGSELKILSRIIWEYLKKKMNYKFDCNVRNQ